jgi:hypothetical protein
MSVRRAALATLLAVTVLGIGVAYLQLSGYFAVDDCLDRGGSYHYDVGECSFTENYKGPVPE